MTIRPRIPSTGDASAPWEMAAREAVMHACRKIAEAPLRLYPTPHFYVEEVFPPAFYHQLLVHFPSVGLKPMRASMHGNSEISDRRFYLSYFDGDGERLGGAERLFWEALFRALSGGAFSAMVEAKFLPYLDILRRRLLGHHHDLLLIHDRGGYAIGPHTDSPQKQCSLLFYCPPDADHPELGTSLFRRKGAPFRTVRRTDSWLRCGSDPEQDFAAFEKVFTAPYLPNSVFGFVRTRYSYHAVEPTDQAVARQLLIYENFSMRPSRRLRAKRPQ